jgi:hypothetical protein
MRERMMTACETPFCGSLRAADVGRRGEPACFRPACEKEEHGIERRIEKAANGLIMIRTSSAITK